MPEGPFEAMYLFHPSVPVRYRIQAELFFYFERKLGAVLAIPPRMIIANGYYFGYLSKLFIYLNIS